MTKDTAEEKIVQIGRKKMALDQALIESMGAEDDAGVDLESILKHGAEALFNDDDRNDIRYDSASVDKLLDRTQVENTNTDDEKTAESQFSFARVWANDKGALTEEIGDIDSEPTAPNFSVWDKILKQREADAAAEAARNMQTFGRGKRARQVSISIVDSGEMMLTQKKTVDYQKNVELDDEMPDSSPLKQPSKRRSDESASDLDFAAAGDSDGDDDSDVVGEVDPRELQPQQERSRGSIAAPTSPKGKSSFFTPPKKTGSIKPKASVSKKPVSTITPTTSGKIVKKQQGSVRKSSVPTKVPSKAPSKSEHAAPTSSNKTVGSKKSEDAKDQEHLEKKQCGTGIKQATTAKPPEIKKGASNPDNVPQANCTKKKPLNGKDTKVLQQKKQEATAVKQPVPSTPSEVIITNLGGIKPTNSAKVTINSNTKPISQAHSPSRKTEVKAEPAANLASAVKEPVASKTAKVRQTSKTPAIAADRSRCSTKPETLSSVATNSLIRPASPSFKAVLLHLECPLEDETLKSALQIANQNGQTTDTTPQTIVRSSTAHCKKDHLNILCLFSKVQTTMSEAHRQIQMWTPEDRECTKQQLDNPQEQGEPKCTKMNLDNDRDMMEPQSSRMNLDNDRDMMEPQSSRMNLDNESETTESPLQSPQFPLYSEMEDLGVRIRENTSAICANAATS
jgi:hypothetical protein